MIPNGRARATVEMSPGGGKAVDPAQFGERLPDDRDARRGLREWGHVAAVLDDTSPRGTQGW
jgi:hypothetical protein